jgi:hypothetical protein
MNDPTPQVPSYFTFRWVLWFCWCNVITGLAILQGILAALLLAAGDGTGTDPLLPHTVVRWITLANAVIIAIVAQVKRNNPPSSPPTKATP